MASANLVSLLNPQKIIWGGGVFGPAGIFIDDIYKEACKWAQPLSIKQVEFVPSQLSGNAGLIGAAFLAIKITCMSNSYHKNLVFTAACIGMCFFGVSMITLGAVLPSLIAKLNLSGLQTTSLVTFLPLGMLAGSLISVPS